MAVFRFLLALSLLVGIDATPLPAARESGRVQGVVSMPLVGRQSAISLKKRQAFPVRITNDIPLQSYQVLVSVGNPPQLVSLLVDTGSSDTWTFGPGSCNTTTSYPPTSAYTDRCYGGAFNPSLSQTASNRSDLGSFLTEYDSGTAYGYYLTDDFQIGGAVVEDVLLAVATYTFGPPSGILGLGSNTTEAEDSNQDPHHPTLVDSMVGQGLINVRAYSLYLDDLESSSGSLLFGGYDSARYTGELIPLDIQPAQGRNPPLPAISFSSFSITDDSGSYTLSSNDGELPLPAILDTGTYIGSLPLSLFSKVAAYFSLVYVPSTRAGVDGAYYVNCDIGEGYLSFGFGGVDGPVIQVPFAELALDPVHNAFQDTCTFGLKPQVEEGAVLVFGETFMRSAYVLYNLDTMQISLAQAKFGTAESNITALF